MTNKEIEELKQQEIDLENIELIWNEDIPSIYADGFQGIAIINDTVRINLYEDILHPENQKPQRKVIARVLFPLSVFGSVANLLKRISDGYADIKTSNVADKGGDDDK